MWCRPTISPVGDTWEIWSFHRIKTHIVTHPGEGPSWERELSAHFSFVVTHPGKGPSWERELFVYFSFVITHPGKGPSWKRELFVQLTFQFFFHVSFLIFYLSSHVLRESYVPSLLFSDIRIINPTRLDRQPEKMNITGFQSQKRSTASHGTVSFSPEIISRFWSKERIGPQLDPNCGESTRTLTLTSWWIFENS